MILQFLVYWVPMIFDQIYFVSKKKMFCVAAKLPRNVIRLLFSCSIIRIQDYVDKIKTLLTPPIPLATGEILKACRVFLCSGAQHRDLHSQK